MPYRYRVEVPTGFVTEIRDLIEPPDIVDAHPGEDLAVITMVGTPLSIRETDFASLKTSVMAHQTLDVETPAPRPGEGR